MLSHSDGTRIKQDMNESVAGGLFFLMSWEQGERERDWGESAKRIQTNPPPPPTRQRGGVKKKNPTLVGESTQTLERWPSPVSQPRNKPPTLVGKPAQNPRMLVAVKTRRWVSALACERAPQK